MLNSIVSWALRMRVLVVALSVALLWTGINAARHAPLDAFPEFAPPLVEVQTEVPGLSTEEVDLLVTVPLENSLNGLPFLKTLRSKSVLGLSSVVMIFETGTDVLKARQIVQERLNLAQNRLPGVARPPVLMAPYSSLSRVLKIGLSSKRLSQTEMSELARWTIRPRLMSVKGVANVAIWGQRDKQYQVLVDPQRLRAAGVSLDAVLRAAGDATVISAGGFIDTPNQRLSVAQLPLVNTAEDLGRTVLDFRDGAPVRLGDVAEVKEGNPPSIGDAVINDGEGILLIVEKQPWGNTLDVTSGVEKALEELKPGLDGLVMDSTIFRPATFIQLSIDHLTEALWLGCALVCLVLAVFLGEWRTTLISVSAIPLSLAAALLALSWRGETINTMVLAGLVIALGEVVDDAIIDVENILRRLRQNPRKPRFSVVLDASLEVRSAVVHASVIIVLVFLPVFFLPGLAGTFFKPLALSYMIAIGASLLVALTVTPALSLMLLDPARVPHRDSLLVGCLKAAYRATLPALVRRPMMALVILGCALAFTAVVWRTQLKEEFLPNFKERDFLMHWLEKPNTSVEASKRITLAAASDLMKVPGVRNQGAHIGRAEVADEVVGPDFTELWISIAPDAEYDATIQKVQAVVDGYPGLTRDLLTFLRERIKEVLTGASASVVVRIYGPDLETLRGHASEVSAAIKDVVGVSALKVESLSLVPQITVKVRPELAALHGLNVGRVREAVAAMVSGKKVGEVYQNQRVHDVVVWSVPGVRDSYTALRDLLLQTPQGGHARLCDVADLAMVPAPNAIKREGASRRLDVTCNVTGRALGDAVKEIEQRVALIAFKQGHHPEVLGEWAERQSAQSRLVWLAGASILGIFAILFSDFKSVRLTLLIGLTLPFALIGGVFSVWWFGAGMLSLGSLVGFVTVLGIAARNGILLISHYEFLQKNEGMEFRLETVLKGSEERLVPILMTAGTAALALIPLVLKGDVPGNEIERPLALVILGGLVTSTVLNLFILPSLYSRFAAGGLPSSEGRAAQVHATP